jgi:hypothetical protein
VVIARVLLAATLLGNVGCATLQPVRDPVEFIPHTNPQLVFVTYINRTKMFVAQPRVSGDSLFGTMHGRSHAVAVPLSQIRLIQARQLDRTRTGLLIAGLAVAVASSVWALGQTGAGESCDSSYYRERCPR